ncbi:MULTISPECIES: hypothetical protein [Paenibacillus]|uniref:hypothetical protein n=1 Tax=Paenibacillus TaxID=44249 RepID=UPI002FE0520C
MNWRDCIEQIQILHEITIQNYISAEELQRYYKEDIHYSLYYWYVKLKKRYFEICGYDAGIDQERFRLLEAMERQMEHGSSSKRWSWKLG